MSNYIPEKPVSVEELLNKPIVIPDYQRPYKWTRKNVSDLLEDICTAIADSKRPDYDGFKYRVGSVILYKSKDKEELEVVDGQQRLITLSLIKYELDLNFRNKILEHPFGDSESQSNIFDNDRFIREWLSINKGKKKDILYAFDKILEAVVLEVDEQTEAFQLFDSQNTRGRALDPHDLLKAYHLREMSEFDFEKADVIKRWEDISPSKIRGLFSDYLYRILKWARKEKAKPFTAQDIDEYKGVNSQSLSYTYAQRVYKAMPYFQIDQPISAGKDFFLMVEYYNDLLQELKKEISKGEKFLQIIKECLEEKENQRSVGFSYAVNLFYCALLFYYDRFHSLDEMAVKKLFVWAMMIRVDMNYLGLGSINNYAIGSEDRGYTNNIPMFFKIATARSHSEIASLRIDVVREPDKPGSDKWQGLYETLKGLMGVKDERN